MTSRGARYLNVINDTHILISVPTSAGFHRALRKKKKKLQQLSVAAVAAADAPPLLFYSGLHVCASSVCSRHQYADVH